MTLSRKKIDNFWAKRAQIKDARVATHFKKDDTHIYDLQLIRKYCKKDTEILDVACGTCYLANELVDEVSYIKGTDKFGEFLSHCRVSNKLEVEVADILEYKDSKKYDIILMFGVVMYFDDLDTENIYRKYRTMLKPDGLLIVKHQCGVTEDIIIDKYSEQIGDNYQAIYKNVRKDEAILKKYFSSVIVVDIYPPRLNPWTNTHFYAFICGGLSHIISDTL